MTLRLQPRHNPDTTPRLPIRTLNSHRDPRAALFVIGLVAASPPGNVNAFRAFADRLADRRSGRE